MTALCVSCWPDTTVSYNIYSICASRQVHCIGCDLGWIADLRSRIPCLQRNASYVSEYVVWKWLIITFMFRIKSWKAGMVLLSACWALDVFFMVDMDCADYDYNQESRDHIYGAVSFWAIWTCCSWGGQMAKHNKAGFPLIVHGGVSFSWQPMYQFVA